MTHGRFLALTSWLVGTLALAGCRSTSSRCCPDDAQARADVASASDTPAQPKSASRGTAFATAGREQEAGPFSLAAIQRIPSEFVALPEKLSKALPAVIEPAPAPAESEKSDKSPDKSESILGAFARQYGYAPKPSGPVEEQPREAQQAREGSRKLFNRGPGIARRQITRVIETVSTDGKPHPRLAKPAPAAAVAEATPASTRDFKEIDERALSPLMEQIHREATSRPEAPGAPSSWVEASPVAAQAQPVNVRAVAPIQAEAPSPPAVVPVLNAAPAVTPQPKPAVVPAVSVAPRMPEAPTGIAQTSAPFGHSVDYTCLSGEVQQWRKGWRLRYAGIDEVDQHGGSVVLAADSRLDSLRDGQHIRVRGRLVDGSERSGRVFQVQTVEIINR